MVFAVRAEPAPIQFDEHGVARIGGTRVTLETVLWTFNEGASPEDIVSRYPALSLADVYAVIAYYLNNRAELDTYLQQAEATEQQVRMAYEAHHPRQAWREKLLAKRKELYGE
jgi:uncharacterized protein (DUF433 family)